MHINGVNGKWVRCNWWRNIMVIMNNDGRDDGREMDENER